MKKIFIGIFLLTAMVIASTSCGSGNGENQKVNNDTIISNNLLDSLSRAMGASDGATAIKQLSEHFQTPEEIEDFLKGFQLVLGNKYSNAELQGMLEALNISQIFITNASLGVDLNRDLYIKEFRKYFSQPAMNPEDFKKIFNEVQKYGVQIENILKKRQEMRNNNGVTIETLPIEQEVDNSDQNANNLDVVQETQETVETVTEVEKTTPQNTNNSNASNEGEGLPL